MAAEKTRGGGGGGGNIEASFGEGYSPANSGEA